MIEIFKQYFVKVYILIIVCIILLNPKLFDKINIFDLDSFWNVMALMAVGLLTDAIINRRNYKLSNVNVFNLFGAIVIIIIAVLIKYKFF